MSRDLKDEAMNRLWRFSSQEMPDEIFLDGSFGGCHLSKQEIIKIWEGDYKKVPLEILEGLAFAVEITHKKEKG